MAEKKEKINLQAAPKKGPLFGPNTGFKRLKPYCACLLFFGPCFWAVFWTDFGVRIHRSEHGVQKRKLIYCLSVVFAGA